MRYIVPTNRSYRANAYAGEDCGPLGLGCVGKTITDSVLGTSNAIQTQFNKGFNNSLQLSNDVQNRFNIGVKKTQQQLEGTGAAGKAAQDSLNKAGVRIGQGNTAPPSVNPASGCGNCGNDVWNPANWACQAQKAACELGAGGTSFLSGNKYLIMAAAAIGGLILLKILKVI